MSVRARNAIQDPQRYARYHCDICDRPFDRKDVLSRHMRVHDAHHPSPGARRRACRPCAQSKTRCDTQRPTCSSCARRKIVCSFGMAGTHLQRRTQQSDIVGLPPLGAEQSNCAIAPLPTDTSSAEFVGSVMTPPASGTQSITPMTNHTGFDFYSPKASMAVTADQCPNESNAFDPDLFFMPFDNISFKTNLDWIFESSGIEECQPSLFQNTADDRIDSSSRVLLMSAPTNLSQSGMMPAAIDNLIEGGALGGLLVPQPQDNSDHGDPWPLEVTRPPPQHIFLPPVKFRSQETSYSCGRYFNVTPINDRTWYALRRCIQLPFDNSTLQTLDLSNFPSKDELDQCIDLYFAHFHPMVSIIHQPTFDPGKDLAVTIAVICIGVCYTQLPGSREFSITLSDLHRRLLLFMAIHDHRFVRTQSYLVAQLLQGTHGYSCGSELLFEHSESSRHSLIYHAKCMGLFRSERNNPAPLGATTQENWQNYIRAESARRLGWTVYQYDASVAYLHNNRPFLGLADLNLNLPGSDEHWNAENADVWASFHPWSKHVPPSPLLRPTLASFFDGSPNPAGHLSEEHLLIIALMLLVMLWSMKEFRSFPLEDLARPFGYESGRQAMMRAMDQIKAPILTMADSHTKSEMERLVHRTQLIHIAHIYAAGDLMNWLFPYLRNDAERDTVKARMLRWANEDHKRMREVAYHSAQILALVRHYPSMLASQSFLIFHAGVVLSCMSFLLPESSPPFNGPPIQLDMLGIEESADYTRWLESGGNSVISLTGVPSLCCSAARQLVLDQTASLLKRHKTWGIAENLMKVVLSFGKHDA